MSTLEASYIDGGRRRWSVSCPATGTLFLQVPLLLLINSLPFVLLI